MGKKKVFYLDPDERKWTMENLGLNLYDFQDLALMNKKLEGTFLARDRKIVAWTDTSNQCPECSGPLKFNDEYDSKYCISCNEWQESSCEDPTCDYCSARPNKPSDL